MMTVKEMFATEFPGVINLDGLLEKQGLDGDMAYTVEIGKSAAYRLAYGYGLFRVYICPDISQADVSYRWNNKEYLKSLIGSIFNKYAPEENPFRDSESEIEDISCMM
jgi:hypothetical protein